MMLENLSIVVPYRDNGDSHRSRIFEWSMSRWKNILPECELIVGEMESTGPFCLAEARNGGIRNMSNEYILLADADVIGFRKSTIDGLMLLFNGAAWVLPYYNYLHLTSSATEILLGLDPTTDISELKVKASYPNSNSGLLMMNKNKFWEAGGFDERFKGWGPEDQCFVLAAETLVGPSVRVTNVDLYHMYHDVKPNTTTDSPYYQDSCELWDRYKNAAYDKVAMKQLVEEWQ